MLNMDEDFHIELNKKQHHQYQDQFSTSDTESSEHEPAATGDNYAPLVSSPDSPTKTMAAGVKDKEAKETSDAVVEDGNSEITSPSMGTDDCPTVVVTAITGGDTPVSDDDMELKEKEEAPVKEEKSKAPAEEKKDEAAPPNSDAFECSFPDPPAEDPFGQSTAFHNPDAFECSFPSDDGKDASKKSDGAPVKMEVDGSDSVKSFGTDVSQNAETTG